MQQISFVNLLIQIICCIIAKYLQTDNSNQKHNIMEKHYLKLLMAIIILFFASNKGITQNFSNPSIEWQKCYGGSFADYGINIIQTSDGGYISVGNTQSVDFDAVNNHSQYGDAFIVKLSMNFTTEWIKCLGGSTDDYASTVIQTSDNGYILSGSTDSNDGDVSGHHNSAPYLFSSDGWIVKLDSFGEIVWQKCYGGTGEDIFNKIIQTNDGGFICAGYSNSNDGDVVNPEMFIKGWVLKIDSLGSVEWSKCYGDSLENKFYDIIQTNDGGYMLTGKKYYNDFNVPNIMLKINNNGNIYWQLEYGSSFEKIYSIKQLSDGTYIGVGQTVDSITTFFIGLVLKISNEGEIEWIQNGDNYLGCYSSVQVVSDSCFVIGGYGKNDANNSTDFLLLKMSNEGNIMWEQYYGGIHTEKIYSFKQTTDQGFILTGITSSEWAGYYGDYDMWIVKLSAETGISENDPIINFQIYPNPTQDILTIQVDPTLLNIPYKIYSITGQLVLSGNVTSETMILNLGSFSEGIYFLQIGNQTKKILKIK